MNILEQLLEMLRKKRPQSPFPRKMTDLNVYSDITPQQGILETLSGSYPPGSHPRNDRVHMRGPIPELNQWLSRRLDPGLGGHIEEDVMRQMTQSEQFEMILDQIQKQREFMENRNRNRDPLFYTR